MQHLPPSCGSSSPEPARAECTAGCCISFCWAAVTTCRELGGRTKAGLGLPIHSGGSRRAEAQSAASVAAWGGGTTCFAWRAPYGHKHLSSMSLATFAPCAQPLRPQRGPCMYRRAAPGPSRHAAALVRAAEGADSIAPPPPEPLAASSTAAADPPPAAASTADSLSAERLKQLRRDGLEIKNVIKLGRKGVADGLVLQIRQRWNTSEVRAGWLRPTPPGVLVRGRWLRHRQRTSY